MSLERKDFRGKLDPDWHDALKIVAEVDRKDVGEWIEELICRELARRVSEATVISDRVPRPGISGKVRERGGS